MAQLVVVTDPLKNSHLLAHVRHCELSISYNMFYVSLTRTKALLFIK